MNNRQTWIVVLSCGLASALLLCAVCLMGIMGALWFTRSQIESVSMFTPVFPASPSPVFPTLRPTLAPPVAATPPHSSGLELAPAFETLRTFDEEVVPINDPVELAERLEGRTGLARQLEAPLKTYSVGDRESFWVTDTDTNATTQVGATLRYETENVYFWIQDGVRYNERELRDLVETFQNEIYPRNREFFGSEWIPGVDADPHLYILYARGMGGSVAGYFSSVDEYLPSVREKTNSHEMFLLSADHVSLGEEYAYGVLAHEFQHMIHWYRDRNEETWMNEGFSDLAMFLNNYSIGGADMAYVANPDIQLNDWPTTPENRSAHYGAAFLYMAYFLDRFGEQATQMLVADEANGMASIDNVLAMLGVTDAETGRGIGADDVFADWAIASYLRDGGVGDGRYTYHNYPSAPGPRPTETIDNCPLDPQTREVSQYGVDYIRFNCRGEFLLRVEGSQEVAALPADPHSGSYTFYSNRGDESSMTLTREFDFSNASGELTLSYWTWYDIEQDYDYVYLLASEDGKLWKPLTTPSGTGEDPVGNSYGWAYNGVSGGGPEWIEETVDISEFAGKQVRLRFEYITDAAVNGEGFLLDDVAIPEIGYSTDFEADAGGWESEGFVRIQNALPQTFRLALIHSNGATSVHKATIPETGVLEIPLTLDRSTRDAILVISGTTRFTRQPAVYRFSILPR